MKILSLMRLLEAKDPEGKDWDIVVIEAGLGKNNRFYPAEVLKKASPLYQHLPVNLFKRGETFDHLSDELADEQFRLVGNQVGFLEDPRFREFKVDGQTKKGILARLHIDAGAKSLRAKLLDWWNHGVMDKLGLSHNADGPHPVDPATGIEQVESIDKVDSVELVSFPAQGGQFLRLLASQGGKKMDIFKTLLSIFKKIDADLVEGIEEDSISEDQFLEMAEAGLENENFLDEAKAVEAKVPFMQGLINRVVKLLKGDKKDAAIKILTDLLPKLEKYGYPKVSDYYGYPSPAKASAGDPILLDPCPEGVDESAWTDCMGKQMKAGKSMKDAAKICKVELKKKESGDDGAGDEDPNLASIEAANKAVIKAVNQATVDRIAKVEENLKKSESAAILEEVLGQSDLFEPVKAKIRAQFKDKIFEKKDLEESVQAEKAVLAKLSESGNLKGLGQSKVQVTLAEADKRQIAMDLLIGVEVKDTKGVTAYRGLKEAYRSYNPDDPDVSFQQPRIRRMTEATLTPSDFAWALGTSITRKFVKLYKQLTLPWKEFVNIVPVSDFKEQERIRWGGFGELPPVGVDGEYQVIASPTDEKAKYSATKRGGLFAIARETIKNDDLHVLRQVPTRLARAAARTLSTFVWAFLKNGEDIYDDAKLFAVARGNLGSAALSYDALSVAITAMKSMRERGNQILKGNVTGGTVSTLVVAEAVSDAKHKNKYVRIVLGKGVGQYRTITETDDNHTLDVSPDWVDTPDATSDYEISEYTDEKVGIKPKYLAVPSELEAIGQAILTSEYIPFVAERTKNPLQNVAELMTPPQLTDADDWYLIADKAWIDMLEIGFVDGKEDPMVLVQDAPGVGAVFTHDRITYKVRHEYGGAIIDYRGFYKSVVA